MDSSSNWEFAASIAAVSIGLSGLLLFTLLSVIGSWRVLERGTSASTEAAKTMIVIQDLARQLAMREVSRSPSVDVSHTAGQLSNLRLQADALLQQQKRLQDAVRNLVEAGVLRSEGSTTELRELEGAVKRLEENLARIAAAVAKLGPRQT
jgi:HAMP domain-containing protein